MSTSTAPHEIGLDCSTLDTTYASLETLLELNASRIRDKLRRFSPKDPPPGALYDLVIDHVLRNRRPKTPDYIIWFHATRVPLGTTFHEGLLPRQEIVDAIRMQLTSMVPAGIGPDRVQWREDGGPYGCLVRDHILSDDGFFGNYLSQSELVENFVGALPQDRGSDLLECFRAATCSCIVKFRSSRLDDEAPRRALRAALLYAYSSEHCHPLGLHTDTCFDGGGVGIPPHDILNKEFLSDVTVEALRHRATRLPSAAPHSRDAPGRRPPGRRNADRP
jgi:hypothetical protein